MDLLTIAFYLSVLTYYLGVLFYMLPIPLYGVKKWAPQLMIDGIFSAILVFSYSVLLWIIDYMGALLGADWSMYNSWLGSETASLISLLAALKAIGIGLSSIGLQFLASGLISPLISTLTYILLFILTFTTLVYVLRILSPTLIALGILLHSLPFRLSRNSGSMLIAVTIVFSIGTPLLPQFINLLSTPTILNPVYSYGFNEAVINILDRTGHPISYPLIDIIDLNETAILARYMGDSGGIVNASTIDTGVPSSRFYMNTSIAGYQYIEEINPQNYTYNGNILNITVKLPDPIQLRPLRLVIVFDASINITYRSTDTIWLTTYSYTQQRIIVIGLESDTILTIIDGEYRAPSRTYYYTWGGVEFEAYEYWLENGIHTLNITIIGDKNSEPEFETIRYVADTLGLNPNMPQGYVEPVVFYMYRLLIAPLIYVSILLTTSISLSKLLGGSSNRIAKLVVTGV